MSARDINTCNINIIGTQHTVDNPISINAKSNDLISDIKNKVIAKHSEYTFESIHLVKDGRDLNNFMMLEEYDISDGDTIIIVIRAISEPYDSDSDSDNDTDNDSTNDNVVPMDVDSE